MGRGNTIGVGNIDRIDIDRRSWVDDVSLGFDLTHQHQAKAKLHRMRGAKHRPLLLWKMFETESLVRNIKSSLSINDFFRIPR